MYIAELMTYGWRIGMSVERVRHELAFTTLTAVVLLGCHGSSPARSDGGADAGASVTITQVHGSDIPPGAPVSLKGVIVTAIDAYGARTGDIWVEEPAGGPLSGVHIYRPDPDAVATLTVGDIVDVSNAIKANYTYSTDTTGRFDVELEPPMEGGVVKITKTGTGTVPTPYAVNALAVGMMTDVNDDGNRSAQWAMFDGVLIVVNDVTQTSSIRQVGSSDPTLQQFDITGAVVVETDLAPFPTKLGFDACLTSVTGVVEYFLGYEILPRTQAEIQVASDAAACPPAENTPALCSDGIDNDGNGYTDCDDNNCIISYGACSVATTISAVDMAADANPTQPILPAGAPKGVTIAGATITAVSSSGTSFWVATSGSAAADGGLYVYATGQQYVSALDIGKTVDLVGSLQAYNNDTHGEALPELDVLATRNLSSTASGLLPSSCGNTTNCTAAELSADATGRPYVGSLVTLNNVKLTASAGSTNDYTATLSQKSGTTTTSFEGLSDIYLLTSPATTCYATLTGVWTYDVYNNVYALEPTAEGVTSGGSCL